MSPSQQRSVLEHFQRVSAGWSRGYRERRYMSAHTYGMRGWLGSLTVSFKLSTWITRRFAENEPVSALLARTIVFAAHRA